MDLEGLTEKRNLKGTVYYENESSEIVAKKCSNCGELKVLAEYPKEKAKLGGCSSACKECKSKRSRKWREENPEYMKTWCEENREHKVELNKKWREENRDKVLGYGRKWYEGNREHGAENGRKWRKENWNKVLLSAQRRRARKASLPDDLTKDQMSMILANFNGGCALSGEALDIHWDHVIPLTTGFGGTTFANMIPLRSDLNVSKYDKNIFEWFEANRQRFELSQDRFDNLIAYLASANAMSVEEYRNHVYWCHANPRNINELEAN
jgi:hypothetical protein